MTKNTSTPNYDDPLFGGLLRSARILNLPEYVFVFWLMCIIPVVIISFILIKVYGGFYGLIFGVFFELFLYGYLVYLTRTDEKGVGYALYNFRLKRSKLFDGITYEPNLQYTKGLMDFEMIEKQTFEHKKIPYERHHNETMIRLVNGDLMSVIECKGVQYETESDDFLNQLKKYRAAVLLQIGNHATVHVYYARRRVQAPKPYTTKNKFANVFLERYSKHLDSKKRYENKIYLSIVLHKRTLNVGFTSHLKGMAQTSLNEQEQEQDLRKAVSIALNQLISAEPTLLSAELDEQGMLVSRPLELASYLLNLDDMPVYLYDDLKINSTISHTRKIFKKDAIEFMCANGKSRAGAVFGVPTNAYPQSTNHKFIDSFLNVPNEIIVSMSFTIMDRGSSSAIAKDKQEALEMSKDDSISQMEAISEVRDHIVSGKMLNGMFNIAIMVHADNAIDFKKGIENVRKTMSESGFIPRREDMICEPTYYGMLAGNYHLPSRAGIINSLNYAGMASLHNTTTGIQQGNHWKKFSANKNGDYVLEFMTESQTPYYFSWHVEDVGHTRVLAPTGGGKTTLINALLTGSSNFDPYIFHFDYLHSAATLFECMGGKHLTLLPTISTGWNPLQLEDTPQNRGFLHEFFSFLLSQVENGVYTIPNANENEQINTVIKNIYSTPKHLRRLKHIAPLFGVAKDGNLAERLKPWLEGGTFGSVFDNDTDNFSIEGARLFCFEMKHVIDSPYILQATIMYIAHRIDLSMTTGEPFILVFEEGQKLLQSPIIKRWLKNLLTTIRKRNGMLIFITPTPEVLVEDADLRQQFKTSILFPNFEASHETYCGENGLKLSDKEYDFIKNTDPKLRKFLVKTGKNSKIMSLYMNEELNPFVHIFSGNEEKFNFIRNRKEMDMDDLLKDFNQTFGG